MSEAQLRAQLEREGLSPSRWSNGPDAVYGEHAHPYGKVLVVASGSMTVRVNGGERTVAFDPHERTRGDAPRIGHRPWARSRHFPSREKRSWTDAAMSDHFR